MLTKIFNFKDLEELPSAVFVSILYGNDKSYYLWNNSKSYYEKLDHALDDIIDNVDKDYLYFSFISLCSATLEYSLNFLYAYYCYNEFSFEMYKSYLDIYTKMNFKSKLFILPYILSQGKYVTNDRCKYFKALCDLIKKRNGLLHNSEKMYEYDFPDIHSIIQGNNLLVPVEYSKVEIILSVEDNLINSITKEDCISVGNAMLAFYKYIMIPYVNHGKLEECDFILSHKSNR